VQRSHRILALGAFVSVAGACSEPTEPPAGPVPLRLVANAGSDAVVLLPANVAVLYGSAGDGESRYSWRWTKVSGPDSYSIESPESRITKVTNLEPGLYEFELAVQERGLTGTDTVGVLVLDPRVPGVNEVIHENPQWICPWGCFLYLGNIRSYAPHGRAIKVFLQARDAAGYAAGWVEVPHESLVGTTYPPYVWIMSELNLLIVGSGEYVWGRVKVTY
jgi:hypothetical protein